MDLKCEVKMEVELNRHAKAYVLFRGRDSYAKGMYALGFGQRVDGEYGWYTAYIAMDKCDTEKATGGDDEYASIPVYGGCTYADTYVPGIDISEDFPDGAVVYGWDYNHGYSKDWSEYDEHEVDLDMIRRDILNAWDVLKDAMPSDDDKDEDKKKACERDLSKYFDNIGDIWWVTSKDGKDRLPILFCPVCGRPMRECEDRKE